MAEQRGSGKLSRADAVAIAALCLLLIVLVPVLLAKPREQAVRQVCAANLAQIGKAMFLYANDYEDNLPRAGGPTSTWDAMLPTGWAAPTHSRAYGTDVVGLGGVASISSCFYLLVKYVEVPPRVFICRGDQGTTEFDPSEFAGFLPAGYKLTDLWDFGPTGEARRHCSYSYHVPFGLYGLTTSDDPNLAVAADRNPWIGYSLVSMADAQARFPLFRPDVNGPGVNWTGTVEQARKGNTMAHQSDGQNVLFLDGRVEFTVRPFCSLDKDNIYTISTLTDSGDLKGTMPVPGPACLPKNRRDSLLVQEPYTFNPLEEKPPRPGSNVPR